MNASTLTHLEALEAESIHVMREVVAEFQKPVMMFSIGKDSMAMLRVAQKAFAPGKLPFPLLHVNTTFKFKEMIEFRDRIAREMGFRAPRVDQSGTACARTSIPSIKARSATRT
jgi:sulfate adenylyltransferase subunit 2